MTDLSIHCDVALGEVEVDHPAQPVPPDVEVSHYELRGLGYITGVRAPVERETIRKSGATSGTSTGTIVGRATVYTKRRQFLNTYKTSNGFTRSGDSGALVVGSDMRAIGIHAWGDKVTITNPTPASYFAGFTNPDTELDPAEGLVLMF
jgi:hypothetical protein